MTSSREKATVNLKSQSAISSSDDSSSSPGHGGRRRPPYAFTEQGVAMLSSVLRSPRAILVNVEVMRAIRALMTSPDAKKKRAVGFRPPEET